jgi:hypothetical protein
MLAARLPGESGYDNPRAGRPGGCLCGDASRPEQLTCPLRLGKVGYRLISWLPIYCGMAVKPMTGQAFFVLTALAEPGSSKSSCPAEINFFSFSAY